MVTLEDKKKKHKKVNNSWSHGGNNYAYSGN